MHLDMTELLSGIMQTPMMESGTYDDGYTVELGGGANGGGANGGVPASKETIQAFVQR